ncbi:hypothetical protein HOY80DRAFT_1006578 [Tuber brumale]|nr:hypothetical protein HOY80DRAFT_1006578 [Tuber brumale]
MDLGKGRKLDVWDIYVGAGRHRDFEWPGGEGNVVIMEDVNARNEMWRGDEEEGNVEGVMMRDWIEEQGLVLGTPGGMNTRIGEKVGERDGVLDIGVWAGELEVKGRLWENIGGLDHKPLEMNVMGMSEVLREVNKKKGVVDWERFRTLLRWEEKWEYWEKVIRWGGRRELDGVVSKKRWRGSERRWWNKEVEVEYEKFREKEKKWEKGERKEEEKEKLRGLRKGFKSLTRKVKGEYWGEYLEKLGLNEGFRWIKGDRDFVVDVPVIEVEGGERVEGDIEKGVAIVRGLGKREELEQEEEGFEGEVELDWEEVEEVLMEQEDGKVAGENGLGGKVIKEIWSSGGIIMRKPHKLDYGLPSSYRVINLLDIWGKGLERLVYKRLEKWGEKGMGNEQFGEGKGRSSMEAVGMRREKWEKEGERGLLLCMGVMGGYEKVGVRKMDERLEELEVDMVLRKW